MPQPFPHQYKSTITRTFASRGRVASAAKPTLSVGPSPQMDGDVATWSAEHLLLSSIGTCLLSTFEAIATRDGIQLHWWEATVTGQVEQTIDGLQFTRIVAEIEMEIDGNSEVVEATLEDTKNYALVTNALRVPVVVEATIYDRDHRRAAV
jgi:organic hydroperoxide reductase OsmC/OhrA